MARPTKFKEKFSEQAYQLCLIGATDLQLAAFFEVSEWTINKWKHDYPEFSQSLKRGKHFADAKVAASLFKRANGFDHDGKHYPADVTACIFWLKNRQPKYWRDKQQLNNDDNRSVEELTDKELEEIIVKSRTQHTH